MRMTKRHSPREYCCKCFGGSFWYCCSGCNTFEFEDDDDEKLGIPSATFGSNYVPL